MPSSSGYSDIRPDRIQAREDQYLRDVQARCHSLAAQKSVDSTELRSIGAHLVLPKHGPWSDSLELTDNEAMSSGPIPILKSPHAGSDSRTNTAASTADGSPAPRTYTPIKGVAYLPSHEYKELQRRISSKSKFAQSFFR